MFIISIESILVILHFVIINIADILFVVILVIFILVDYIVNTMKDYTDLNNIPTFGNFHS